MDRYHSSLLPLSWGGRFLLLAFAGFVGTVVALGLAGATAAESVPVGAVVGLLVAVAGVAVHARL